MEKGISSCTEETLAGPLSVTMDIADDEDGKYLAFSIHFSENSHFRTNGTTLQKMVFSKIDSKKVFSSIRSALSNHISFNTKITNFVTSNSQVMTFLRIEDVLRVESLVEQEFVCFKVFASKFIRNLMEIDDFKTALSELKSFVVQLSIKVNIDLPSLDDEKWETVTDFIAKCLSMHDKFIHFAQRWKITYITQDTFEKLEYIQKIIEQCAKCCQDMCISHSTISQVIPAIMSMRYFMSSHTKRYPFEKNIRQLFIHSFQELASGIMSQRYDIAALLDPRFGYSATIYNETIWLDIEKKLVGEVNSEVSRKMLISELNKYKEMCVSQRPEVTENPSNWWAEYRVDLESLAVFAKEYLACPAVSIDANVLLKENRSVFSEKSPVKEEPIDDFDYPSTSTDFRELKTEMFEANLDRSFNRDIVHSIRQHYVRYVNEKVEIVYTPLNAFDDRSVKTEPVETETCVENVADVSYSTPQVDNRRKRVKASRCTLCKRIEGCDMKIVVKETDRWILLLGAVYRDSISIEDARDHLRQDNHVLACPSHFSEASIEILLKLGVKCPARISSLPQYAIADVMTTLTAITGQSIVPGQLCLELDMFTNTYFEDTEKTKSLLEFNANAQPAEVKNQILPKSLRQPRKQVFEKELNHWPAKLPKVETLANNVVQFKFEKELNHCPVKLPRLEEPANNVVPFEHPKFCCFCSICAERVTMLKLPNSEESLSAWREKLPEFYARLQTTGNNYICRSHFPVSAFTTRGRLLKGMLPMMEPDRLADSFKLDNVKTEIGLDETIFTERNIKEELIDHC